LKSRTTTSTLLKSVADPSVPAGLSVFGIQDFGGLVHVSFAADSGAIGGYIDNFAEDGTLLKHLTHRGNLIQPWGFAIAANNFSVLSNTLLISNNLNTGASNAYDPVTGPFVGILRDDRAEVISIDQLRGVAFGDGAGSHGNTDQLCFTAGPDNNFAGLLGVINAK
jgi:uncharacterized protein (TIGR03118 family)